MLTHPQKKSNQEKKTKLSRPVTKTEKTKIMSRAGREKKGFHVRTKTERKKKDHFRVRTGKETIKKIGFTSGQRKKKRKKSIFRPRRERKKTIFRPDTERKKDVFSIFPFFARERYTKKN